MCACVVKCSREIFCDYVCGFGLNVNVILVISISASNRVSILGYCFSQCCFHTWLLFQSVLF